MAAVSIGRMPAQNALGSSKQTKAGGVAPSDADAELRVSNGKRITHYVRQPGETITARERGDPARRGLPDR
jgi:hypothetical protein